MAKGPAVGQPVSVAAAPSLVDRLRGPAGSVWGFRASWATLPLSAGPALAHLFVATSNPVRYVGTVGLWAAWIAVLIGSLVPAAVSLSTIRLIAPGALVATTASLLRSAPATAGVLGLAAAVVSVALAFSAEVGLVFIQGSAYGDESRFPLRPLGALLLGPLLVGWLLSAAAVISGPLLLAARSWVGGVIITAVGFSLAILFGRRCHRLARRFLVFVPAGVVVHDAMVLGDTAMFRKSDVASFRLAEADTQAADLTGKALGNAVEITLKDFETVILAATPGKPGGSALHAKTLLVSPSRPGRVLAEAARRGHRLG